MPKESKTATLIFKRHCSTRARTKDDYLHPQCKTNLLPFCLKQSVASYLQGNNVFLNFFQLQSLNVSPLASDRMENVQGALQLLKVTSFLRSHYQYC